MSGQSKQLSERERRLVKLWDLFVKLSTDLIEGTVAEGQAPPSAAQLREIRTFLERNQVDLAFVESLEETPGPRGRMHALDEHDDLPFAEGASG